MLLANVAGVSSSKELSQAGFEDVMAVLEDLGFEGTKARRHEGTKGKTESLSLSPPHPITPSSSYWRDKVAQRGQRVNERMVHKIRELAGSSIYPLYRLAWRQSGGRTDRVEYLTPREAWMLIEMLKASNQRTEAPHAAEKHRQPSLF